MKDYNKAILIGHLTKDVEHKTTTTGKDVSNFTIAVNGFGDDVSFIPIVVWGKASLSCAKYLAKGSQCLVDGSIKTRSYEAKDGTRRYITEVHSNDVQFLGGKADKPERKDMQTTGEILPF